MPRYSTALWVLFSKCRHGTPCTFSRVESRSVRTFWRCAPFSICQPHNPHRFCLLGYNRSYLDVFVSFFLYILETFQDYFVPTPDVVAYIPASVVALSDTLIFSLDLPSNCSWRVVGPKVLSNSCNVARHAAGAKYLRGSRDTHALLARPLQAELTAVRWALRYAIDR